MRVVHGLQGDSGVIAVEVAVLDEVFDGVDDLDGLAAGCWLDLGIRTRFIRLACSRRASNTDGGQIVLARDSVGGTYS